MTRRALRVGAVLAGALALAAAIAAARLGGRDGVPTARVVRERFAARVSCEGTLRATKATPVNVPLEVRRAAKIGWLARDGTYVKAGDLLASLDPTPYETALQKGRGDLATSDHQIERTKTDAEVTRRGLDLDAAMAAREVENARTFATRDAEIYSRFEIIESEIDAGLASARKNYAESVRVTRGKVAASDLAILDIERRKVDLEIAEAKRGLAALEVRAPHDGILVLERDWRGNNPRVGDTVWAGNKLGEIPSLDSMEAEVFVLEADAGGLAEGQRAEVFLDSRPGVAYPARVKRVDTLARPRLRGSPLQFFAAVLEIEGGEVAAMKPGQRVRATLTLAERESALMVPREAVFSRDGEKIAYRKKAWGGFVARVVTLGPSALGRSVIEAGLAEGDLVALVDPNRAAAAATPGRPAAPPQPGVRP